MSLSFNGVIVTPLSVTMRERPATSATKAPMSWYLPVTRTAIGNSA
ncbi:Uncharacterised protein [Mycobacterium tuberculosis]|nr:Uncharacterised protein [Mycobacterium tuberculosis]